eukprot:TRINITY_DN27554_c0_g1_i1.p1 TRINITY_DN27554_c0_g1~~TRINITY_DN27554_c0_g1_i1.p1  ORF type:complete len:330 (+),score=81.85 TRINITY_DN27554_c0_g1_i1:20-1009(+)
MCAAGRKTGDGMQKEAGAGDDLPLCAFCEKTYDGCRSPCSEQAMQNWFGNLERASTHLNKLVNLDNVSRTALHVAVDATNSRFVEFVLRHKDKFGLNLEVKELPSGRTALMKTLWDPENWKLIPDLVKAGARVSTRDADSFSTLHAAALTGLPLVLAEVLLSQVEPDELARLISMRTVADYSALHLAALYNHADLCELLLRKEPLTVGGAAPCADVNEIVHPGRQTAMHMAAGKGHLHVCEVLLRHSEYRHMEAVQAWLPLHLAAYWGHDQVVLSLLLHQKDFFSDDVVERTVKSDEPDTGMTALRIATIRQQQSCAEIIRTFTNLPNV